MPQNNHTTKAGEKERLLALANEKFDLCCHQANINSIGNRLLRKKI
jgi:hypothetical protein